MMGIAMSGKIVKDIPRAMKSIWANVRGRDDAWARIYEDFKK